MKSAKIALFMKQAVAAIITNNQGQILLIKRSDQTQNQAFQWENPGGKLENGETPQAAVVREVQEELGVKYLIQKMAFVQNDEQYQVSVFIGSINDIPQIQEPHNHIQMKWFDKKDLSKLDLTSYSKVDFERLGWI